MIILIEIHVSCVIYILFNNVQYSIYISFSPGWQMCLSPFILITLPIYQMGVVRSGGPGMCFGALGDIPNREPNRI